MWYLHRTRTAFFGLSRPGLGWGHPSCTRLDGLETFSSFSRWWPWPVVVAVHEYPIFFSFFLWRVPCRFFVYRFISSLFPPSLFGHLGDSHRCISARIASFSFITYVCLSAYLPIYGEKKRPSPPAQSARPIARQLAARCQTPASPPHLERTTGASTNSANKRAYP